jgi:pyruvate formate lyase activating enzyme
MQEISMSDARYWTTLTDGRIRCNLCPHACSIAEGSAGICKVRKVENRVLAAAGYGRLSSMHLDPIEKKPLYHFFPGRQILSLGGWGCNLGCEFCQNWSISQDIRLRGQLVAPEELVNEALSCRSAGLAYTYNEPIISIEFVMDCSALARARGMRNVLVTNGFVQKKPAADLLQLTDALNIDIKSIEEDFYRKYCRAGLRPVLDFCIQAREAGCHIEITNLLIPGLNDGQEQIRLLAEWVAEHLGDKTPLHLSGYHPDYKMTRPATAAEALERVRKVCIERLKYVYIGNVRSSEGQNTHCPNCGAVQVKRDLYSTRITGIRGNKCDGCGEQADIILD